MFFRVAPSFSTAAAAENGHDKGDIILSMTGDLASQINGVLDNIICKRTKRQAGTITSCDVTGARSLLLASVAPGLLEAFRLYAGPFFQFVDKDFLTVQTQLFDWAKSINLQFDSDSQLKALAGAYLYLTISRFHSGTPIAMSNDIPASAVSPDSAPTSSESSKPCPPPDRQPMCLNCGGETTTGKCLGVSGHHFPRIVEVIHEDSLLTIFDRIQNMTTSLRSRSNLIKIFESRY